jgi:hypothetical protein
MSRRASWLITVVRPPLMVIMFVLESTYALLFGWWLNKGIARANQHRLRKDIQDELWFLFSEYGARIVPNDPMRFPPPLDYAVVTLVANDLNFKFVRGRGDLDVYVGPDRLPRFRHELSLVLSQLDVAGVPMRQPLYRLANVQRILRPYMDLLRDAFSEDKYPELERRLSHVYENDRLVTRQVEAGINTRLQ